MEETNNVQQNQSSKLPQPLQPSYHPWGNGYHHRWGSGCRGDHQPYGINTPGSGGIGGLIPPFPQ